jgi:diguanylate cyclase (GGDEF)-like protein
MDSNDLCRDFWIEQIRLAFSVVVGAVAFAVALSWFTTGDLDPHARTHVLALAIGLPLAIVPIAQFFSIRLRLRYLRLNLKFQHLADSDDLTSLANRRSFTRQGAARLARKDIHTGLILVDIDWFKRVNDNHGHEAGDETLCHIAQTLVHAAPYGAIVARLGGEEFTVMCHVDNVLELSRIAEALRKATEAAGFYYRGKKIHVTISLGLTLARPDDTLSTLLSRADNALYDAKNKGRNRFELAA